MDLRIPAPEKLIITERTTSTLEEMEKRIRIICRIIFRKESRERQNKNFTIFYWRKRKRNSPDITTMQ